MKLLRKGGQPFLLLPLKPTLRAAGMALYAPQSKAARSMKWGFGFAARLGVSIGLENVTISLRTDDPFVRFLRQVADMDQPQFAMLAGNPNAPGQRCLFLLFDAKDKPAVVVKTGAGSDGKRLITQEIDFLKNAPQGLPGLPKLRSIFENERLSAFAMDFYDGVSPRYDDQSSVHKLLSAWAEPSRVTRISELPVWQLLLSEAGSRLSPAARELGGKTVSSVTMHGDFAPWNIRVKEGHWTVLDWERGDTNGLPLWDWLHFLIQPTVLVAHATPEQVLVRLNELIKSPRLIEYVEKTKARGLEIPLISAYLDNCIYVIRQTEGLETIRAVSRLYNSQKNLIL
jgi:hypothetical protein